MALVCPCLPARDLERSLGSVSAVLTTSCCISQVPAGSICCCTHHLIATPYSVQETAAREFCMAEDSLQTAVNSYHMSCSSSASGGEANQDPSHESQVVTGADLKTLVQQQEHHRATVAAVSGLLATSVPAGKWAITAACAPRDAFAYRSSTVLNPVAEWPAGFSSGSPRSTSFAPFSAGDHCSMFPQPAAAAEIDSSRSFHAYVGGCSSAAMISASPHLWSSPLSTPSQTGNSSSAFSNFTRGQAHAAASSLQNLQVYQADSSTYPKTELVGSRFAAAAASCCDTPASELKLDDGSDPQQQFLTGQYANALDQQYRGEILPCAAHGFTVDHYAGLQAGDPVRTAQLSNLTEQNHGVMNSEDIVFACVDRTITELMTAMPAAEAGATSPDLQHLFAKLLEVLQPSSVQLVRLIEARFHAIFFGNTEGIKVKVMKLSDASTTASVPLAAGASTSKATASSSKRMRDQLNTISDSSLNGRAEYDLHEEDPRSVFHLHTRLDQHRLPLQQAVTTASCSRHPLKRRIISNSQLATDTADRLQIEFSSRLVPPLRESPPPVMEQRDSSVEFAKATLQEAHRSLASSQPSLDPRGNVEVMREHSITQQQQQQQQEQGSAAAAVQDQFHHMKALEMSWQQPYDQPPQQYQHHLQLEQAARTSQNFCNTLQYASAVQPHNGCNLEALGYEDSQQQQRVQYDHGQPLKPSATEPASGSCSSILHVDRIINAYDEKGFELLALLLQCAEAMSAENVDEANSILPQLNALATPYGSSVQRVVAYFAEGMASRLITSFLGISSSSSSWSSWSPVPLLHLPPGMIMQSLKGNEKKIMSAVQVFNEICPFVKFSHFTANQAIVDAFEGMRDVHIIDIDIMQGLQWPALFHILAARPGGPPQVIRITGLGTSIESLQATGKRLSDFAQTLGLRFEYIAVADRIGNVDPSALQVRNGDALAVHWMQHSLYDVTGDDPQTLNLLKRLSPNVITMVEQDLLVHHDGSFINRFVDALHYYSALFDSLGASYGDESPERHVVEQQLFSCEIKNILAVGAGTSLAAAAAAALSSRGCSGTPAAATDHGVRPHVKFVRQWKDELSQAGFKRVSLSHKAATQAALLLGMFRDGYTLLEQIGTLKLGWKDLCLLTASAWSCN
jgi:hypothetical protein